MSNGMFLKVEPEALKNISSDVSLAIDKMDRTFQEIAELVNRSSVYWEGKGERAYIQAYGKKAEIIQTALNRFRENVTDLQKIAGIYEQSEREIVNMAAELPADVIS